jgi:hypothetical protein
VYKLSVLVALDYYPIYSRDRDWENYSSRPAGKNMTAYLKNKAKKVKSQRWWSKPVIPALG